MTHPNDSTTAENLTLNFNKPEPDFSFYKKARELWKETQQMQIEKGMEKYPEPFNPFSWTPAQLLLHAMQENVDQMHYMVGLYDQLASMESKIEELEKERDYFKKIAIDGGLVEEV